MAAISQGWHLVSRELGLKGGVKQFRPLYFNFEGGLRG